LDLFTNLVDKFGLAHDYYNNYYNRPNNRQEKEEWYIVSESDCQELLTLYFNLCFNL